MTHNIRKTHFGMLFVAAMTAGNCGCGGGAAIVPPPPPPPAIRVSTSQATATVQPLATAQFTATVSNDASGKGVTWSMTCNGATCGSVSPAATAIGAPTTYTAPGPPGVTLNVVLTATSVADTTKSASVAITVPAPTTVSVSPPTATVPPGGTQQFTATVGNDSASAGVTWHVLAKLWCDGIAVGKCNPAGEAPVIFLPCSGCGTVSPVSTANGAPMIYTAPAHLTAPSKVGYFFCYTCSGVVLVVATSVTYTAASATAYLTIPAISVSISPAPASVALGRTQQFTATVTNDASNSGVNWTLTQSGIACSPACGTITSSTASGVAATYTAPTTAPITPLVRVIATSVEDPAKSAGATVMLTTSTGALACGIGSGNESLLKGQYAFLVDDAGGSITADGTGKITGGEEDLVGAGAAGTIDASISSYALGPDHRGCLVLGVLANTNGTVLSTALSFSFSLGSANSSGIAATGRIMELDRQLSGGGIPGLDLKESATGTIRLQDPSSFAASQFNGNYVTGLIGTNVRKANGRVAMAGILSADGASALPSGTFDINDVGAITSDLSAAPEGTFTCCDTNGRGNLTLQIPNVANLALYMVNSGNIFLVTDNNDLDVFQGVGEAIAIPSTATFDQGALNRACVLHDTAQSASGPVVDIATASADGKGIMTVNDNVNSAGTFNSSSTALNYTVASDGRVTFTGGSTPPVIYLYGPNQGFLVGTDRDVTFGVLEAQAAGPFSDASFSGAYVVGTENPSTNTVTTESGVLTANGSGNATGTVDQSSPAGLTQNQNLNFTYSFPANGIGNVGSGTTAILISGNKLVFINNTTATPTITIVEK